MNDTTANTVSETTPIRSLEEFLERLCTVSEDKEEIDVGQMLAATGRRAFGPLLLLPGVIVFSPLSGIPGLPSAMAALIILIAGQLILGRKNFWLPQWILCRRASRKRLRKAVGFMQPVARFADKLLRVRLRWFTVGPAIYVIGAMCILVALTMPVLELIPFGNSAAGFVITVFGLALISEDGLLAFVAMTLTVSGVIFTAGKLLGYV